MTVYEAQYFLISYQFPLFVYLKLDVGSAVGSSDPSAGGNKGSLGPCLLIQVNYLINRLRLFCSLSFSSTLSHAMTWFCSDA